MSLPKSDGKGRSGPGESPGQTGDTGWKIMIFSVPKAKFFSIFATNHVRLVKLDTRCF